MKAGRERKGGNTDEDDEGYLPASQDAATAVRSYMVCTDPRFDLSHRTARSVYDTQIARNMDFTVPRRFKNSDHCEL
jgi:hypothetical protein